MERSPNSFLRPEMQKVLKNICNKSKPKPLAPVAIREDSSQDSFMADTRTIEMYSQLFKEVIAEDDTFAPILANIHSQFTNYIQRSKNLYYKYRDLRKNKLSVDSSSKQINQENRGLRLRHLRSKTGSSCILAWNSKLSSALN